MIKARVLYSGTVQGVGFRYTAQRMAAQRGVAGWVKNLPDGRVEILGEGPREAITQLLEDIDGHFKNYIRSTEVTYGGAEGRYKDFRIAF